jgi:hypothetical protein
MYGCTSYYHGWSVDQETHPGERTHGHGHYCQHYGTDGSTRGYFENVFWRNWNHNWQAYNEGDGTYKNVELKGNAFFSSGVEPAYTPQRNFLIGGYGVTPAADGSNTIHENFVYDSAPTGSDFKLGYMTYPIDNPNCHDNFLPGINVDALMTGSTANVTGNILTHTEGDDFDIGSQNTFRTKPLTGQDVFVRPNAYETGRANIIVYNWDESSTVSVDVSSVLSVGDHYAVYNYQNLVGVDAVVAGTYTGSNITLPMTSGGGLTQAAPVRYNTPPATWPKFNVFLIRKTN